MAGRPLERIGTILAAVALAAVLTPAPGRADFSYSDLSPFGGIVATLPVAHDTNAGKTAVGIDLNVVAFVFNGGVSYRHWDGTVEGWNEGRTRRNEVTWYVGLGALNLLQAQIGVSGTGTNFRVRSDIVLFGDENTRARKGIPGLFSSNEARWGPFRRGLVISPFIEASPWSDRRNVVYGAGLGVVF